MSGDGGYSITYVDNSRAWGPVMGRHAVYPDLLSFGDHVRPYPGMLVSSYLGERLLELTGMVGLGVVLAVLPHPEPRGDVRSVCIVLWNFDASQ